MVAKYLERGVFTGAFGKVHQAHVVANHEGQGQRDQCNHGKDGGQHIQHLRQLLRLVHGPVQLIHFLHGIQLGQTGLRGPLEQDGRGHKGPFAQAFPGAAFHI